MLEFPFGIINVSVISILFYYIVTTPSISWFCTIFLPGGGPFVYHRDVQAAACRGGHVGDDQRAVGPHHVLHAHVRAHRGRLRDSKEAEPACRPDWDQTLVKGGVGGPGRPFSRLHLEGETVICPVSVCVFNTCTKRTHDWTWLLATSNVFSFTIHRFCCRGVWPNYPVACRSRCSLICCILHRYTETCDRYLFLFHVAEEARGSVTRREEELEIYSR